MKKAIATLLAVLTLASVMAIPASAQTYFWLGSNSYSYNNNQYCTCALTKPGKKDASVKVTLVTSNCALSIKMTDNKGRHIWSEDYSIRPKGLKTTRKYTLGRDHSVYRLYFKATKGKGTGSCNVTNPKNCSIY